MNYRFHRFIFAASLLVILISDSPAQTRRGASYPYFASPRSEMDELQRIFRPDVRNLAPWLGQLSCSQIWDANPPTSLLSFLNRANPNLAEFYRRAWTPALSIFNLRSAYLSTWPSLPVPASRPEFLDERFRAHLTTLNRGRANHLDMDYCSRIPLASRSVSPDPQGDSEQALRTINQSPPMSIEAERRIRASAERVRTSAAQSCCSPWPNGPQRNRCLEYFNRWTISWRQSTPETPNRYANAMAEATSGNNTPTYGNWFLWNQLHWRSRGLRLSDITGTNILLSADLRHRGQLSPEGHNSFIVSHESGHVCRNAIRLYLTSDGVHPTWTNPADWQDEFMCSTMTTYRDNVGFGIDTQACSARSIRARDERMYSSLFRAMDVSTSEIQCLTNIPLLHPRERFPGYRCETTQEHSVREEIYANTFALINELNTPLAQESLELKRENLMRVIFNIIRDAEHPLGADVLACLARNPERRRQFNEIFGCRQQEQPPAAEAPPTATTSLAAPAD